MTTPVIESSTKPTYSSKFEFPVYLPALNDKIIIRCWDKRKGFSDLLIANIPEILSECNNFNINSLESKGGHIPYHWVKSNFLYFGNNFYFFKINLYGLPGDERNSEIYKFLFGKTKTLEGTEYFGRVLISMNLAPNKKPSKGLSLLHSYREPPNIDYLLRVDVYELHEALNCGESVRIKVSIGNLQEFSKTVKRTSKLVHGERVEIKGTYIWKDNHIQIDDLKMPYPADKSQIPDVFISVYTLSFMGERRVAYLRIPIKDGALSNRNPSWYPLKSIDNQLDPTPYGYLLMNIQFKVASKNEPARVPKKRSIKCKYYLIAFIYAGYDIAPQKNSDEVQPQLEIRMPPEKPFIPERNDSIGKNPVWNEFLHKIVEMDENLEFSPNLFVCVTNGIKKMKFSNNRIGEFFLPAMECKVIKSIQDYKLEPKLYTLFNKGEAQGRILASFTLLKSPKKSFKFYPSDFAVKKIQADVEFSIIGIRNLIPAFKNPVINLKIPGTSAESIKIKPVDINANQYENPNYIYIAKFENIEISYDAIYLPPLEVEVIDEGSLIKQKYFCTISLIERAVWLKSQKVLEAVNLFAKSSKNDIRNRKKQDKLDKNELNKGNLQKFEDMFMSMTQQQIMKEEIINGIESEIVTNKEDLNTENLLEREYEAILGTSLNGSAKLKYEVVIKYVT